jgi:streptogrisin C
MRNRNILAGSILGSLLVAGFVVPTAQAGVANEVQAVQTTASTDCITRGKSGNQEWFGEADSNVTALGNALQEIVDEHPDQATGVALCSHFEGAAVFVASGSEEIDQAIAGIASKFPDLEVLTHDVGAPLSTLIATGAKLLQTPDMKGLVAGVTPDMYAGGLLITVAQEHGALSDTDKRLIDGAVKAVNGSLLPLIYEQGGKAELSTRSADYPPYYMGSELVYSTNYVCSAGVPILIAGVRRLLTAGHCTGSSFYNNGNLVGTTYTTSYPGNAGIYGDWKLIQGSTYANYVYSGDLSSNTALAITGAVWGGRPNGTAACSSGRTTGQICRYYVTGSYANLTFDGVPTGQLLRMKHDSSGTGTGADNNGWLGGDSGGPIYFSDASGGVIATAIVTGRDLTSTTVYYATQLSGVRAWNSGANVGG